MKIHWWWAPPLAAPARSARGRVPRTQVHALTEQLQAELQTLYDEAQKRAAGEACRG